MKEQPELKVNCSKLARQLNCDRRTVSRYVEIAKNGEKPPRRVYPKKTDGFEHINEEKVDISDTGSGFDISFDNHFVRHWEKSDKMMNFNHSDYIEIARRSSLKRLDEDEIKLIAERNLEIYDKL